MSVAQASSGQDQVVTSGGCRCGDVRWSFTGKPRWVMHCHCADCRKATASAVATFIGVKAERARWTSGTPQRFTTSPGVERLFCARCGTPLGYIGERWADEVHFLHGTLDDPTVWPPTGHAYVKNQLPWFEVHDDLPRFHETAGRGIEPVRRGPNR
jgi:hypothetical protein